MVSERGSRVHLGGSDVRHLGLAARLPLAILASVCDHVNNSDPAFWSWASQGGAVRMPLRGRHILITTTGACMLGGPDGDLGHCVFAGS